MRQQLSSTFLLFLLFFGSSSGAIVPLTGNDWTINNNESYFAQGRIPGTIHTILLTANQITEPYWGYNDVNLRNLIHTPWTFRKNFSLTEDFLTLTRYTLHFDQIDTVANIRLNECLIGQTNSMFIAYTFNVMKTCLQPNNELRIDFESPVVYALNQAQAYNDSVPPDCPPDMQYGECHVQFIRKEPCSFSWDWAPAFAPIGITGNLYLEATNNATISIQLESVNVASYQTSINQWQVDVLLSSTNDPFMSQLKFVLENTSFTFQSNITFNHNISVSLLIPNENIQLWWPNGYGDQPLYTLSVYNQGQLLGSRLIGFRVVELAQHSYGSTINGTSFYFVINGHPIYIKGSNWVPPDAFQERVTDGRLERLLRSTQLANMNMLRVWGGGIYERDSFYEIADRLGIMLWHDFMFACSLYPVDELFLTNIHQEVIYQVKRLQSHASIVLWSGNNENEQAVAQNWYRVPTEKIPKTKDDYRKLYVNTVMNSVKEVDKGNNRPFITSSPSNGLESISEDYIATNPQDPLYGDVHFYGFNNDSWNPTTYPITRFLSETGMNSLPSLDTWRQVTQNVADLQAQIKSNLPLPVTNDSLKNFTQMIYLSQINQAMTLKSISDWCRIHSSVDMIDPKTSQGHTMGLMYWQINDIWQAPTSSTIEYGLKWKMGHYYVQHMYEPVYPLAILTPYLANVTDENAQISLYVINELFNGTTGHLNCSFLSLDTFSIRLPFAFDISFNAPAVQHVTDLPYSTIMRRAGCFNSSQCLLHCRFNSSQEEIGQTLFLTQPKNYELIQPNLHIQSIQQLTPTDIRITITATRPALFVWLDVSSNFSGYFSRNGFHMFEPMRIIRFHSWTPITNFDNVNFDVRITSLFDVTQP
ncbi:unnamed protein product [Rotaria sp. Silwood1]|nr:unnamed protein product [Rotaria sp. Silwood1]CAF1482083.1 unnamed protein product [Rotaria sp. Silwood1]CAF3592181.1 unnamed protein product [Rotaria sp. Silwood1]CAF4846279.1 unnamed protein product [Rotaria sp. Silwood1]CAF4885761.1 unnamed protein product [Rotaria sp. Silwood1]